MAINDWAWALTKLLLNWNYVAQSVAKTRKQTKPICLNYVVNLLFIQQKLINLSILVLVDFRFFGSPSNFGIWRFTRYFDCDMHTYIFYIQINYSIFMQCFRAFACKSTRDYTHWPWKQCYLRFQSKTFVHLSNACAECELNRSVTAAIAANFTPLDLQMNGMSTISSCLKLTAICFFSLAFSQMK